MKHYVWHRTDGSIGGHMQFQGGFPVGCDPADPATTDPRAQALRATYTAKPEYGGIVAYTCGCGAGQTGFCGCANARVRDAIVVGGVVTAMATMQWRVDGVLIDPLGVSDPPLDKTPGANVVVSLVGAVPDGVAVSIQRNTSPDLAQSFPVVLTFTGGETDQATLRAPGAGLTGAVVAYHRVYVPWSGLKIRGW